MAAPATAQVMLYDPQIPTGPIEASDPMVGLPLPGATPAEYRAHLLWNLRSGLNVAALQCQFSPYLRTVDNYNALLAHHARELASAYSALEAYFRRVNGAQGPRRFDDYSTQTYNNFSTLQAQYGFCQTAARIGKEALARRKGELHLVASSRMRELRNSLRPNVRELLLRAGADPAVDDQSRRLQPAARAASAANATARCSRRDGNRLPPRPSGQADQLVGLQAELPAGMVHDEGDRLLERGRRVGAIHRLDQEMVEVPAREARRDRCRAAARPA